MKAIDYLKWIVGNYVSTESMGFVTIDEDFDYKNYFGYEPDKPVPAGEYLWLYTDSVHDCDLGKLAVDENDVPYIITTDMEDNRNGGPTYIYLFNFEED